MVVTPVRCRVKTARELRKQRVLLSEAVTALLQPRGHDRRSRWQESHSVTLLDGSIQCLN